MAGAWDEALERGAHASGIRRAMRRRDTAALRALWEPLVRDWDDRTFYDFVATSPAFARLGFRSREMFGQVGFGTGGWDSDFRNTMLEILRVVLTDCDADQHWIVGGAERVPRGLWHLAADSRHHPLPARRSRACTPVSRARASRRSRARRTARRSASPTPTATPRTSPRRS